MTNRTLPDSFKDLDLYVCGFPCQPYSVAGQMLGIDDGRSAEILPHVVDVITTLKPRAFILENVPAMCESFGLLFDAMVHALRHIDGQPRLPLYEVHWTRLDTSVHGGVPQSRRRVYIVGIQSSQIQLPFAWPTPLPTAAIKSFLDASVLGTDSDFSNMSSTKQKNVVALMSKYANVDHDVAHYIGEIGNSAPFAMKDMCPCLTFTRAGDRGYWSFRLNRTLTVREMIRLQGVPDEKFKDWEATV